MSNEIQPTEVNLNEARKVGLRLPNGSEVFPPDEYLGYPLTTEADRKQFVENLRKSAEQLGHDPDEFAGKYQWVVQEVTTVTLSESSLLDVESVPGD